MPNSRGLTTISPEHLEALANRHAMLAEQIEQEQKSPAASSALLRRWKTEKLLLKDQIEQKKQLLD